MMRTPASDPTSPTATPPGMVCLANGHLIGEAAADEAAEWLTLFMSGEATDQDRERWQQWRSAQPDHEEAWLHLEAVMRRFKGLPAHAAYQALHEVGQQAASATTSSPKTHRRKALQMLAWAGMGGFGWMFARHSQPWIDLTADQYTATGEQRSTVLSDGTHILMDTTSAIDVRFDDRLRLVRLVSGQILVQTAHALHTGPEDSRPFLVETWHGRMRALGTRFTVLQQRGQTEVGVIESAVEIRPWAAPQRLQRIDAGQRLRFNRDGAQPAEPLTDVDTAWTRGQIMAEDQPLAEFLARLSRYRHGVVRCDPSVAGLRLSAVFPLQGEDATDRILATLPQVLPVQVQTVTPWWVTVGPRGAA